jgi:hypothetical protein
MPNYAFPNSNSDTFAAMDSAVRQSFLGANARFDAVERDEELAVKERDRGHGFAARIIRRVCLKVVGRRGAL